MKTHLLISFITLSFSFGFAGQIDSLLILPSNPTENDTVYVVCYSQHNSSGCGISGVNVGGVSRANINVAVQYTVGVQSTICNRIDTICLGKYSPGSYSINYRLQDNSGSTDDTKTIFFTVSPASGIDVSSLQELKILPSSGEIKIDLGKNWAALKKLRVYNVLGSELHEQLLVSRDTRLSHQHFKTGILIFAFEAKDGQTHTFKHYLSR